MSFQLKDQDHSKCSLCLACYNKCNICPSGLDKRGSSKSTSSPNYKKSSGKLSTLITEENTGESAPMVIELPLNSGLNLAIVESLGESHEDAYEVSQKEATAAINSRELASPVLFVLPSNNEVNSSSSEVFGTANPEVEVPIEPNVLEKNSNSVVPADELDRTNPEGLVEESKLDSSALLCNNEVLQLPTMPADDDSRVISSLPSKKKRTNTTKIQTNAQISCLSINENLSITKKRTNKGKSQAVTPDDVSATYLDELQKSDDAEAVDNIPIAVQSVLDGTADLSTLEFDEIEVFLFTKDQHSWSSKDINQLHQLIIESSTEIDKCYFMLDMLSEFSRQLDEARTVKADINGLINLLLDHISGIDKVISGETRFTIIIIYFAHF